MPRLIDIHCHLASYAQELDLQKLDMQSDIVHVSTALNINDIRIHLDNSIKYWFAGVHPWDAKLDVAEVASILNEIPYDKIIGIGEIGLDRNRADLSSQMYLLARQMEKASEMELATLYHLVGHEYEFIKLHKGFNLKRMKIMHAFNSSYEVYKELAKLGFYFSISKRILNNPKQRKLVAEILANKRFFLESDAPNNTDLEEVKSIAEIIESDYNININDMKEILNNNFSLLLGESCESISKK